MSDTLAIKLQHCALIPKRTSFGLARSHHALRSRTPNSKTNAYANVTKGVHQFRIVRTICPTRQLATFVADDLVSAQHPISTTHAFCQAGLP